MQLLMRLRLVIICISLLLGVHAPALAEGDSPIYHPVLIYLYAGDDSDSAFVKSAMSGIARAENEFHVPVETVRLNAGDDTEAAIKKVAKRHASPIILLGNQNVTPVFNMASRYPDSNFTVIDGLVPPIGNNVQSILFKDHEGAFLVGYVAGRMTHSGFVGFIGGMDSPLIRNFQIGYEQGAKYADKNIKVTSQMIGNTAEAWSNAGKAEELALNQYREGVDIIFAAAGGSSMGVLKAADDMGKLAIGVDSNQNGMYPGHVLTSMVKRVDVAVYETLKASQNGSWKPGVRYMGLKEGALDYSVDQNNRGLMTEQLIEEVATAKDKIISGKIIVESYSAKNN